MASAFWCLVFVGLAVFNLVMAAKSAERASASGEERDRRGQAGYSFLFLLFVLMCVLDFVLAWVVAS